MALLIVALYLGSICARLGAGALRAVGCISGSAGERRDRVGQMVLFAVALLGALLLGHPDLVALQARETVIKLRLTCALLATGATIWWSWTAARPVVIHALNTSRRVSMFMFARVAIDLALLAWLINVGRHDVGWAMDALPNRLVSCALAGTSGVASILFMVWSLRHATHGAEQGPVDGRCHHGASRPDM